MQMIPAKNIIFSTPKVSPVAIFLSQFRSPLVYILLFAAAVTIIIKEYSDTIVISLALIINAVLGFLQEYQAQNTLQHLQGLLTPQARILRNGTITVINSEDVSAGDTVLLARDYTIPADGEILEAEGLEVNEAILTGESLPVTKAAGGKIFAGTTVIGGIGKFRVTQTGIATRIGIIGKNVLHSKEPTTPLQKQILDLAKLLAKIVLALVFFIFIFGLILDYDFQEMLTITIAIAVAAVPEGLVITITIILTIGMRRILGKKAVVHKLISAETLGSVSVICIDKTGTITEGRLTVMESNFRNRELGELSAVLCNNQIDSLEISMRDWLLSKNDPETKAAVAKSKGMPRLDGIAFGEKHKFTATLNKAGDRNILFMFGPPEKIMAKCLLNQTDKKEWENIIESHGEKGRKIVGFAYKYTDAGKITPELQENLEWNGILVYEDPVRPGIAETIEHCRQAGITIKMITGDHIATARYVGRKTGLIPSGNGQADADASQGDYLLTGEDLKKLAGGELEAKVKNARIFSRIDPMEKLQIVKILQNAGEVVAMTGDGVNDAPALKAADIGVVVNEASDISKSTADIVLLDSNLQTMVYAVREGRVIFNNIRKIVLFLLSGGFTEIILILGALIFQLPLPVTAAQLLWVNLLEDSLPALALVFERHYQGVMEQPPRKKSTPILNFRMKVMLLIFIIISDSMLFLLFAYFHTTIQDISLVRSLIFLGIGIDSLLAIYAFKSIKNNIFTYNPFSNKFLNFSVIFGLLMFAIALYTPWLNTLLGTVPLPANYLLLMIAIGFSDLLLFELAKFITGKFWPDREN